MSTPVGEIYVKVRPDFSSFGSEMQAGVQKNAGATANFAGGGAVGGAMRDPSQMPMAVRLAQEAFFRAKSAREGGLASTISTIGEQFAGSTPGSAHHWRLGAMDHSARRREGELMQRAYAQDEALSQGTMMRELGRSRQSGAAQFSLQQQQRSQMESEVGRGIRGRAFEWARTFQDMDRRGDRFQNSTDLAAFARQKADERRAVGVDRNFDATALAKQKSDESAQDRFRDRYVSDQIDATRSAGVAKRDRIMSHAQDFARRDALAQGAENAAGKELEAAKKQYAAELRKASQLTSSQFQGKIAGMSPSEQARSLDMRMAGMDPNSAVGSTARREPIARSCPPAST
jgi:hypothetical protein